MVGIDPTSEGLARARALGVETVDTGLEGLLEHPALDDIEIVFDATSARAHLALSAALRERHPDKQLVDLTPAALGPYVVPVVNLGAHLEAPNVNLVTCGGQATVPIVAAVREVAPVRYAEIVASISSRSAGPGTRANIDEFTRTTARGLEVVGGAGRGKAIIILNPASPPLLMRNTVFALAETRDQAALEASIRRMVDAVASYVPGYRLVQPPVFEALATDTADLGRLEGTRVTVFLEVEGAGDHLPRYAGNLDIMTSAALAVGERLARHRQGLDASMQG